MRRYGNRKRPSWSVIAGGHHIGFGVSDCDQGAGHDGAGRVMDPSTDAGHVNGLLRGNNGTYRQHDENRAKASRPNMKDGHGVAPRQG